MINKLSVSNVTISEDDYRYASSFTLNGITESITLCLGDLDDAAVIREIKIKFALSQNNDEIRKYIIDKVIEKASLISRNVEGHEYVAKDLREKIKK